MGHESQKSKRSGFERGRVRPLRATALLDRMAQSETAGADDTCRDWLLGYDLHDRCLATRAESRS